MKNVAMKGPMNAFRTNMSSFLNNVSGGALNLKYIYLPMENAKILFSPQEKRLMNDAEVLRLKRSILDKIEDMLGRMAGYIDVLLHHPHSSLPSNAITLGPKISRGEQYRGLPYRVLDYPRIFSREEIFACRTFFWWANHMSITLHLKGPFLQRYSREVLHALCDNMDMDLRIQWKGDEWDHDVSGYPALSQKNADEWLQEIANAPFCKFSCLIYWEDWDGIPEKMERCYQRFFRVFTN